MATLTASTDGLTTYELYNATTVLEDLAPDVIIQGAVDTPVLDFIGFTGPMPKSQVHQWSDDDYDVFSVTLDGGINDTDTTAAIVENGDEIEEGTIIEFEDEYVLVTASSATSLTIVRAQCGTSAAAHADTVVGNVITQATYDNTEYPISKLKTRGRVSNYLQQFLVPVEVSDIARMIETVGTADELDWQREKKVRKALVLLERAFLRGAAQSTPQGSATIPPTMKGLRSLISTNSVDASSAQLTEATLRSAVKKVDDFGGQADAIICNRFQAEIIDSWNDARTRIEFTETTTGREPIQMYKSPYGMQRVIRSRHMRADELYIIDSSKTTLAPLATFGLRDFSKVSTSTRLAVWGVYTAVLRAEKHAAKITSLATS